MRQADRLLAMARGIARGMLHLHTRRAPILHRDLKPANIFVGVCYPHVRLPACELADTLSSN